jgi:anhydro-N-acetylmuramic acid kinase
LEDLLRDPYFQSPPPKSTGKEHFNLDWLGERHVGLKPADVQATLAELTAVSIADAQNRWGPVDGDLVVCGGGRRNRDLMLRIATHLPQHRVASCEELGFDGDGIEAAAFAWLAARYIHGEAGNAPEATGAAGPRILGGLYPGS